jgi:primosomal protein N' (replication factor Y)
MKYAEVAVNSPLAQPRTFTYSIPPGIDICVGDGVWVPFGPRLIQGIVLEVVDQTSVEQTRDIAEAIAPRPVLQPYQVKLCNWIAERYLSSYFEAAAPMLPPGFERKGVTYIEPSPSPPQIAEPLTESQEKLLSYLRERDKTDVRQLRQLRLPEKPEAVADQLVRMGLVLKTREIERAKVRPRLVRQLSLAVSAGEARDAIASLDKKRATRQAGLLRLLLQEQGPLSLSDAGKAISEASNAAQALHRRGLVSIDEVRVQRDPLASRSYLSEPAPTLTPAQANALKEISAELARLAGGEREHLDSPRVFLLHGVTGSGKTEVYLRALERAASLGKRAIVLVPEIALTPQTIARFAARFPDRVAVLHSKLSLGEQYDVWQRVREGDYDVVIGSRGALFAPQPDLGLIVIDEEHEWTYKQQEQQPRYHARDVAIRLAGLTDSVVILGSATPDVGSYFSALKGDFRLLQLPERITSAGISPLPNVEIMDLRRELKQGNRSIFSRALGRAIAQCVEAQEQVILFLNRRGTATFVQCRDCGFVMKCRRCDVSLTYHADEDHLVCHRCNHRTRIPRVCPDCSSERIRFLGLGTQKLEVEVMSTFPGARVLRWDRDATRGKHSHEEIMDRFLAHEADILIGTQMIAKGLDMPRVTLVGVINADIGLYHPDFRSSERTFQLLAQVAGRAGRGDMPGRVIIQSYTPDHYAVLAAADHDYAGFYEKEIAFRREQGDPPFSRLARLLYVHHNAAACREEAERVYQALELEKDRQGLPGTTLFGPTPAYVQRVRGRYRWQIIIRAPDPAVLVSELRLPQGWSVDIDPASTT